MRVLLDHDVPARLRHDFPASFSAETTSYRGWQRHGNGELLRRAAGEYGALVTLDGGIPFQQDLSHHDVRVVILKAQSQARGAYAVLIPGITEALDTLHPGAHIFVVDERRLEGLDLPDGQPIIVVRAETGKTQRVTTPISDTPFRR